MPTGRGGGDLANGEWKDSGRENCRILTLMSQSSGMQVFEFSYRSGDHLDQYGGIIANNCRIVLPSYFVELLLVLQ